MDDISSSNNFGSTSAENVGRVIQQLTDEKDRDSDQIENNPGLFCAE